MQLLDATHIGALASELIGWLGVREDSTLVL
jgi:hypothetical protein